MSSDHQHSKEDEDDLHLQFDSIDHLVPAPYEDDDPAQDSIQSREDPRRLMSLDLQVSPRHDHVSLVQQQRGHGKTDVSRHNGKRVEGGKIPNVDHSTMKNGSNRNHDNMENQKNNQGQIASNNHGVISSSSTNSFVDNTNQTNNNTTKKKSSPIKRFDTKVEKGPPLDAIAKTQLKLIEEKQPTTELEIALTAELERKNVQIEKLTSEIIKLKQFISKRKQTYKRKRKEDGAPTRALSAYNIFVQERFEQLAKQNEEALMSSNTDKTLQRVPPASLVAQAGNEWRELPPEQKEVYKERAKADKKRYEEEMEKYNPPENPTINKKRNKTGYNLFFSEYVDKEKLNRREDDDLDHDSADKERGNLAKVVGNAWKNLSLEEREEYERRAESINDSEGFSPEDEQEGEDHDEKESSVNKNNSSNNNNNNNNNNNKKDLDTSKQSSLVHNDGPMMIPQAPVVHQPGHHDHRSPYHHPPPPPPPHGHFYPPYPYEYYPPIPMPHPHAHHLAATHANHPGKEDHPHPHHHHHDMSNTSENSRHMPAHHLHPFPYPPPPPHYMHPHYRHHEQSPHNPQHRPSSPSDL
mmetsp:Transcript_10337/g.19314  ORF Transcript_10337/g.19314 Transcript_10337/m.19314 type:complete len:580 (+) Transcript_10337:404-2143(+)